MTEEKTVKGIVISAAPQGEYGRRLTLVTDRLGRTTAFAQGAAKAGSHIIGAIRPMTCAEFDLVKGRSAWNLRSVRVIDAFDEISRDVEASFYAAYFLELGEYFSGSGMPEEEARNLLNLLYVSLKALRDKNPDPSLVRRILELRLLKLQGEYTLEPSAGLAFPAVRELWKHCLGSSLTGLYRPVELGEEEKTAFEASVEALFRRQTAHHFRAADILQEVLN